MGMASYQNRDTSRERKPEGIVIGHKGENLKRVGTEVRNNFRMEPT